MGDINVLNPLQTVVPACGQVRFCDSGDDASAPFPQSFNLATSVGPVLLVVRYGKYQRWALDDLSHRSSAQWWLHRPFERGSSASLGVINARVVERRHFVSRGLIDATRLHREGWIDTEVGLT